MRRLVAVVGPGSASDALLAAAEEVGARLAAAGAGVVCGGRGGVMEAACRGARAGGGLTVGLLPGTERSAANAFVDVVVPTGLGEARNVLVVRAATAVIAVGGEYGTLSEIAFALKLGVPVVGLASWRVPQPPGTGREAGPPPVPAPPGAPAGGGAPEAFPTAAGPADAVGLALAAPGPSDRTGAAD